MRRFLPFALLLFAAFSHAQQATKLDLRTALKLQKGELNGRMIPLLVKGNLSGIKELTAQLGGRYKYGRADIAAVEIPASKLDLFQASPLIQQIGNSSTKGTSLMDTARIQNNIDSIHAGYAPLINGLKGSGVVIGIIDDGIDWQHKDFQKADGSGTRIRYIWDQDPLQPSSVHPQPYDFGTEWNWLNIDLGNCGHVAPPERFGHGTSVAGIVAGNGLSVKGTVHEGTLHGVAPEADIIAVRIKDDENYLENIVDAVDYCFKKADALGKPCVINTSTGTYYGSHDGTDLHTQMIEALLDERNGRVLVAAAGNAGNVKHHIFYEIPADSAYTFFKYNNSYGQAYFDFWADTADFGNASFTVGCNDALGSDLGRISYYTAPSILGFIYDTALSNGSTDLGNIYMIAQLEGDKYHVEFSVENVSNTQHLWRLQFQGSGKADLWNFDPSTATTDIVSSLQNVPIQYANYVRPDSLKTIVSSWQCSDKVITVGNYSNRTGYFDRDSNYQNMTLPPNNEIVGKRFVTSSFGPTRDNRLKPDIMATGSTTISTGDSAYIALAVSASNRLKIYVTKKHARNGGTSMASPIVAGVAALYLQKHPNATYREIKDAIILTARKDNFTGSTDNPEYGHGKLNGFAAVTYAGFVYGTTDTACINYNPNANVDTGGCQQRVYGVMDTACLNYSAAANTNAGVCLTKIYGCTDPAALNYDSTANIENSTCQYPNVGINEVNASNIKLNIMPNPFNSQTTFNLVNNGYNFTKGSIRIVNQLGAIADEISIGNTTATYNYSNTKLAAGVYFYTLILDGKRAKTGKLIVE